MKENKLLICAIAVMIAALGWSIIATIACVMLDRKNGDMKVKLIRCEFERTLLRRRNENMKADTAWMMDVIREDARFLEKLNGE